MGIGINVSMKNDYSYLFSSMNKSNTMDTSFLTDYSSIKSGSYGKLLKAYYAKDSSDEVKSLAKQKSASVSRDDSVTLSNVEKKADAMKKTLSGLTKDGEDSLYAEGKREDLNKKVEGFVEDYNSLLSTGNRAFSSSINSKMQVAENTVAANTKGLAKIGITVNADRTLSINSDMLQKASTEDIKAVFQKDNSMGERLSAQVGAIGDSAKTEASKANTYTGLGTYGNNFNVGGIYNSFV